jgi:hypothetical protein
MDSFDSSSDFDQRDDLEDLNSSSEPQNTTVGVSFYQNFNNIRVKWPVVMILRIVKT